MKYSEYLKRQMNYLDCKTISPLEEKEWQPFYIPDIFEEVERGKRLKRANQTSGSVPYVSSTSMNNGVDAFIEEVPRTRVFADCISLANSGSVGSAFYEPFRFIASDHVTHLKSAKLNKWHYLFLASTFKTQKGNFSFNREINDARIKRLRIMLPVTDEGKPDYCYMEQYVKNVVLSKYRQYFDYLENLDSSL